MHKENEPEFKVAKTGAKNLFLLQRFLTSLHHGLNVSKLWQKCSNPAQNTCSVGGFTRLPRSQATACKYTEHTHARNHSNIAAAAAAAIG